MVRGLDLFRKYFKGFENYYVIIGGTACSIAMEKAGQDFRSTKDIDIVLCVEALTADFFDTFWKFIDAGKYSHRRKLSDKNILYRFQNPEDESFPFMLELFSRIPDIIGFEPAGNLTPIPAGENSSSLSAILLDTDYYNFLRQGIIIVDGISIAGEACIIPLKAKAWLDLTERRDRGESVDSKDIKKHLRDIPDLFMILMPDKKMTLPKSIAQDLSLFLERASPSSSKLMEVSDRIRLFYNLEKPTIS